MWSASFFQNAKAVAKKAWNIPRLPNLRIQMPSQCNDLCGLYGKHEMQKKKKKPVILVYRDENM